MSFFHLAFLIICLLPFFSTAEEQTSPSAYTVIEDQANLPIRTPSLAGRKKMKIRLNNGLEAYLVSDPKIDQSGAALSVQVGTWEDPKEYPGLAHFLEHMLFLGTKKYPKEAEYKEYISQHSGDANAYTSDNATSYMFSVNNNAFEEALDRFSNFFKEPLFNPSGVARELQAIDQEYFLHRNNDDMRLFYVDKEMANPDHPYHHFHIGNTQTLSKVSQSTLKSWYQQHYSANIMKLIVYSSLPIDKLRDIVVADFQGISNRNKSPFASDTPLFVQPMHPQLVYIEPVTGKRSLAIMWDLPIEFSKMKDSRPEAIACQILGDEGEESLLAELKRQQLAEEIACGADRLSPNHLEFLLEVKLTDKGVKEVQKVVTLIFQTIAMVKEKNIPSYYFDDLQRMQILNYQYQDRVNVFHDLMAQTHRIFDESLETYPEKTQIVQQFDPDAVKALFNFLTPEQARFYVMAPANVSGVVANRHEKWMGTAYASMPIDPNLLAEWAHPLLREQIDLAKPNRFIPRHLALLYSEDSNSTFIYPHPELILNNDSGKVYFAPDTLYQMPQISWTFEIKSPLVDMGNAARVVLADLYVKAVTEALKGLSYPASSAGLHYEVERGDYGIKLNVYGYSDNASVLFEELLKKLTNVQISKEEFQTHKESLQRDYQNFSKLPPYQQALEFWKAAIYKKYAQIKQKSLAINKITYETFRDYVDHLFDQTYVEGMLYGNMTRQTAEAITEKLIASLKSEPFPLKKQSKPQVILLPDQQGPFYLEVPINTQGNAVILGIQYPYFDVKTRGMQQVLMQAIKEPFFDTLRTKQQTGYLVASDAKEIHKQLFNLFIVQSNTHAPRDLLARFELFLESYLQEITQELPEERFNVIKNALATLLEQPPKSINEMGELLHKLAFEYDGDFDWIPQRVKSLKELSYPEFLKKTRDVMGRENKRRLAVLATGNISGERVLEYAPVKSIPVLRSLCE